MLATAETAPDGSPAVRLESSGSRRYRGPKFPVEPGKCYIAQAWIRRGGDGEANFQSVYHPEPGTRRRTLGMILTQGREMPGQWTLFTRIIPAYPQHTFWIPWEKVGSLQPTFHEVDGGTEIAGWTIREVDDWPYAQWLKKLAMKRDGSRTSELSAETCAEILDWAAVEPLTTLDYHGDWLVHVALQGDRPLALAELFESAHQSDPNPLFALPKIWRLIDHANFYLDQLAAVPEVQLKAGQLLEPFFETHGNHVQKLDLQARLLAAARLAEEEPTAQRLRNAIEAAVLKEEELDPRFVEALTDWKWKRDQPHAPLLKFLNRMQGEKLLAEVLERLPKGNETTQQWVRLHLQAVSDSPPSRDSINETLEKNDSKTQLGALLLAELFKANGQGTELFDLHVRVERSLIPGETATPASLRSVAIWMRDALDLDSAEAFQNAADTLIERLEATDTVDKESEAHLARIWQQWPEGEAPGTRSMMAPLLRAKLAEDSELRESLGLNASEDLSGNP